MNCPSRYAGESPISQTSVTVVEIWASQSTMSIFTRSMARDMHFSHAALCKPEVAGASMESRELSLFNRHPLSFEPFFDTATKDTVIRLRWPLVILSSYLLYYAPSQWLTPTQVQALLIFYLLSHATLYFVSDELFDSPHLYGPLLLFDTVVLLVVLEMGGSATPEFVVAGLLTLVLSCICNDARGLLTVTLLAPVAYAYFVFRSDAAMTPEIYLRLPFPFVISLFYGYFAQVERMRKRARENEQQVKRQQKAAEDLRRQRERLETLHEINQALTSTNDQAKILDAFLNSALIHLPYAAILLRLKKYESAAIETVAAQGIDIASAEESGAAMEVFDSVITGQTPLIVDNVFTDSRTFDFELFKRQGLESLLVLPLTANDAVLGCLAFFTREEHRFSAEEIDFLSTLAGQAAIAIHHAQLYHQSRRQADELQQAHTIKDEFLLAASTKLKTPLNLITGCTEMLSDGLLGETTPIQEKALETIAREGKELQGLIDSLLLVTNIETEALHVDLHEVNFWELLCELRSRYEVSLRKEVRLLWDLPSHLPVVQCDRSKLTRILANLIDNALKFTDRGTISVSVRYSALNQQLNIGVADSGVGIPSGQLATIFERFRQAHCGEAGMQRGGFGLGLYVVKKYVDLLGGSIQVASRVGEGSNFTLQIPVSTGTGSPRGSSDKV